MESKVGWGSHPTDKDLKGLKHLLEEKKCFKLICGAGNENLEEVEKLVALYSKAGVHFFDLSASQNVLNAAKKGLDFSVPKDQQQGYHFCVSVGIQGEPHLNKAKINKKKCHECKKCMKICPQEAVAVCEGLKCHAGLRDSEEPKPFDSDVGLQAECRSPQEQDAICKKFKIHEEKCIGCLRCLKVCKHGAIEIYQKNKPIDEILDPLFSLNPTPFSCLELHASGDDEDDVNQRWNYLNKNFDGMLSVCIDRSKLGNEAILKRIKNMIKDRKPYSTIIQADGAPMSGGEDDFKTTLQAVSMAEIFQDANLPVYILLSGGTNSKSTKLASLCGIEAHGVSIGSYARKIVKKYIEREDFLQNETVFNEALEIARELVERSLKNLNVSC